MIFPLAIILLFLASHGDVPEKVRTAGDGGAWIEWGAP